jgi:conjugative transfer signal peptidase TraF
VTRKRSTTLVTASFAILGVLLSTHLHSPYRLLYNPSESAPRGWYVMVSVERPRVDDFVVVRLPETVAAMAAQRGYLPKTVPLLKHVAGIGGQQVCSTTGSLTLDGRVVVHPRDHDGAGRPLIPWAGCRALAADEVLLLSTSSDSSFDSRYFGPVHWSVVIGRAIAVWTW